MKPPDNLSEIWNSTIQINGTAYPAVVVSVVPGKYSDHKMLNLNWSVVSFAPGELQLQLNFENPAYVSSLSNPDSLKILIYAFYLFTDFRGNMMAPESLLEKKKLPTLLSPGAAA